MELNAWIEKGWLVPHHERQHGPPRGLVPLLAVQQKNKAKVRPVMDFRELNGLVTAHTADSDVCADVLRKWRCHGANVAGGLSPKGLPPASCPSAAVAFSDFGREGAALLPNAPGFWT